MTCILDSVHGMQGVSKMQVIDMEVKNGNPYA